MTDTYRSARLYFWPLISANVLAVSYGVGTPVLQGAGLAVALCCLASFGFLLNDLSDRAIDLVNEAGHFERADAPTVRVAFGVALILLLIALAAAAWVGWHALMIAIGLTAGLAAYSPILRRVSLLPNLATAMMASSPMWAPLVLSSSGGRTWHWCCVAAFVTTLAGREILMDVRDVRGDACGGRITLATRLGQPRSARVGVAVTVVSVVLFIAAVCLGLRSASLVTSLGAVSVAAAVVVLLLVPVVRIPRASVGIGPAIQSYVLASRVAMALVPLLIVILAGT